MKIFLLVDGENILWCSINRFISILLAGVVDQIENGVDTLCDEPIKDCSEDPNQALCKYKDRIDVIEMKADLSIGPVFARHIGHRMYRGE